MVDLDKWLRSHPRVAAGLIWDGLRGPLTWESWDEPKKAEFREAFALAQAGRSIFVKDVPPNKLRLLDDYYCETVVDWADAWAYYKASAALSLALEAGGKLRWSLEDYNPKELALVLDSRTIFTWEHANLGYRFELHHGSCVPCSPARTYSFLSTAQLIGQTRLDTVWRLLGWCGKNLTHFYNGHTAANMEDHWQYRGHPPLARVLTGTVYRPRPQFGLRHWTAGCSGTVGLLRAVLRAVNIPVQLLGCVGHAQACFTADALYLAHGDDPYDPLLLGPPAIPPVEYLVDKATHDAWFAPQLSDADKIKNMDRRRAELAVIHLPLLLLSYYCQDRAAGKTHATGQVCWCLGPAYTVPQLEALNLWERMDRKLVQLGGCDDVERLVGG